MRMIAWLLRVFCYLFHTLLSLALIALGTVAMHSNVHDLKLDILPWQGTKLNHMLIVLGLVGLFSILLALTSRLRFMLELWSLYVLGMLTKAVFFSPDMSFSGREDFHTWLLLILASILALLGSLTRPHGGRTY